MKTSASAVKCLSARTSVRWMSRRQEELGNWSSGEWFGQGVWGAVSMGVAGELVLGEAWVVEERTGRDERGTPLFMRGLSRRGHLGGWG